MKNLLCILIVSAAFAQQPGRGPEQRQPRPSDTMTTTLSEQDVTVTFHVSAAIATAIEKDRRDQFHGVVDDKTGITSLVPNMPTLAEQIMLRLQPYFEQVLKRYPPADLKSKQDAVTAAQKAVDDAAAVAGQVQRK